MTIEAMLVGGLVMGLLIGAVVGSAKTGCAILLLIPTGAVLYVAVQQALEPDTITSTSALDFLFAPAWPSFAGIVGFAIARAAREMIDRG